MIYGLRRCACSTVLLFTDFFATANLMPCSCGYVGEVNKLGGFDHNHAVQDV